MSRSRTSTVRESKKKTRKEEDFGREAPRRDPKDVDMMELYRNLEEIVSERPDHKGYSDATQCQLTPTEVRKALDCQGIHVTDMEAAIRYCIEVDYLHEARGENFTLDRRNYPHYRNKFPLPQNT